MDRSIGRDPRRQAWKEFICSSTHAGRHLSNIGQSVAVSRSDQIDIHELEAFLDRLKGGEDDVVFLANVVELTGGSYADFLETVLPDFLEQLSSETERRDQVVGPALVGSPRWGQTQIARRSGHLRFGQYYSRTAHRSYDVPENRVLAWLVHHLDQLADEVFRRARLRSAPLPIQRIADACDGISTHPVLWTVASWEELDHRDLAAAETSNRAEYRVAARLCRSLLAIMNTDPAARWHAILMLLAVDWLEPVADDDLFELFVLVTIIDVLGDEVAFGEAAEYGLVVGGRRHVALFEQDWGTVSVHFDTSALAALGHRGKYPDIVAEYDGVTGSERRPDIIVSAAPEDGSPRRVIFVEIKRSDSDRYVSDGIYKVFGYLHDHQQLWPADQNNPRAILVIPGHVTKRPNSPYREVAVVSGGDRSGLASAIRTALNAPGETLVGEETDQAKGTQSGSPALAALNL
jgi:hypothetical protein